MVGCILEKNTLIVAIYQLNFPFKMLFLRFSRGRTQNFNLSVKFKTERIGTTEVGALERSFIKLRFASEVE